MSHRTFLTYYDIATGSKLVLGGKTPGQAFPALNNNAAKARLIKGEKKARFPHGQGLTGGSQIDFCKWCTNAPSPGVYHQYLEDLKLPIEEQYIQKVVHGPDRGVLVLTFDHYLIQLIHDALSFEVDTTFSRVYSDLNEWEIVIWSTGDNRRKCTSHRSGLIMLIGRSSCYNRPGIH
jgi:hypothetical protein